MQPTTRALVFTFEAFLEQVGRAVQKRLTPTNTEFEINSVLIRLKPHGGQMNQSQNCIIEFELKDLTTNADTNSYLLTLNRQLATQSALTGFFALNEQQETIVFIQKIQLSDIPVSVLANYFQDTVNSLFELFVVQVGGKAL